MPGGTWNSQNKVLPGVYIRFKTGQALGLTVGERGTVTICEPMSWGPVGQVTPVTLTTDVTPITGYDITDPHNQFLQEMFKGTNRTSAPTTILLYRPTASGSAKATVTTGQLTATALYPGARGNDITIVVTELTDPESTFTVSTVVDGAIVDQQTAAEVTDLVSNAWVTFSGSGALTANTGAALTGGQDGTVQSAAYSTYLTAIEPYDFDIMVYDGQDSTVQTALLSFIERVNDNNGQYCQLVASGLSNPNSRYVINVNSPVTLSDGTELTPQQVTWWAGGAQAGAMYNQSLTYAQYPGAVSTVMWTVDEYANQIQAGNFVLFAEDGVVKVMQDINTLTTYTEDIGQVYSKNRVMRLCNTIANDIFQQFSANFIGVVNNNEQGRARFQAAIVGYLQQIQDNQGIQNFASDDVEVLPGTAIDAIVVNVAIQAVDSVEKIYMTVEVS
jgi:phage tail sheath protein|nr:MAG TPA: tail sheath protein [Caudoviricetes sp.]